MIRYLPKGGGIMAEATISATGPVIASPHAAAWDGARGGNQSGERRKFRGRRAHRLLEAIVPGKEPELFDVHFEYHDGEFAGVSIRERATGEELTYLDTETLRGYEESPGLLLERQG
jgi:hypothetical protein